MVMDETASSVRRGPGMPWRAPRPAGDTVCVSTSPHLNLKPISFSRPQARDRSQGPAGARFRPVPAACGGFGMPVAPREVGMSASKSSRPGEPPPIAGEGERRAAVRHPCGVLGPDYLVVRTDTESRWARPCDVSVGGIGLLLARPVAPGTKLTIPMRSRQERLSPPLRAAVVHARPQADGTWRIGCAFDHTLSVAELEALL